MQWQHRIPIEQTAQTAWPEPGMLDDVAMIPAVDDGPFQAGFTGQPHFGRQLQPPVGFNRCNPPEIHRVARQQAHGVAPTST